MNFFGLGQDRNNVEQHESSIPGAFPASESSNNREAADSELHTVEDNTAVASSNSAKVLHFLLQIPLYILFYLVSIILIVLSLLRPILNFNKVYDKRYRHHYDHSTDMVSLLDELASESVTSTTDSTNNNQFTFGSLYNSENGPIPSQSIQTSYLELLDNCSSQLKFGLIYLHDPLATNKMNYIDEILCSDRVVNCIKTYQMLLWFGDVTTSEGLQVANALKVRNFPYIGILAKKTSETAEIIYSFNGPIETYDPKKLESILVKKYPSLLQMIEERQNIDRDRVMREQQDERFRESLRRDQERDRQRREAEQMEQEEMERERLRIQWLLWRRDCLSPEPQSGEEVHTARIAIRLDDNTRITRKFLASLPIEEIYAFVELSRSGIFDSTDIYEGGEYPPNGYNHRYSFGLFIPAPRRKLPQDGIIADEPGIFPSGNLVMEVEELGI